MASPKKGSPAPKSVGKKKSNLMVKLMGAGLIVLSAVALTFYLDIKPELKGQLEPTPETLTLTNLGSATWPKAEIYINHPLKGLRYTLYEVIPDEPRSFAWLDFKQVYQGNDFKKGPVHSIWLLVEGYDPKKFTPQDLGVPPKEKNEE